MHWKTLGDKTSKNEAEQLAWGRHQLQKFLKEMTRKHGASKKKRQQAKGVAAMRKPNNRRVVRQALMTNRARQTGSENPPTTESENLDLIVVVTCCKV